MKLKKTLLAVAATLPLLCTSAYAGLQVDNWKLDTSGVTGQGLTRVVSGIDEILFTAVAHAVWSAPPAPGVSFTTNGLGVATQFNSYETGILGVPELNQVGAGIPGRPGWELTFDWTAGGHGIAGGGANNINFTHDAGGFINFYIDNLDDGVGVRSTPSTGAGYTDGKKFASFKVLSGEGGVLDLLTSDGSDDASWLIDLANTLSGVLWDSNTPANDLGINETTDLHTDSNFDANPVQGTLPFSYVAGGFACGGTPQNHCAKEDGSAVLTVPEPASLALLGLGLAGIAFGRRRSNKA